MSTVDLNFDIVGEPSSEPDVIILHGLFGMGRNWAAIARALAKDRRVFTVDLRNHGKSPWADEMTYPLMADDVAHLIERHCDQPPIVIGHSMGGKTAMTLALSNPDVIARLGVVDIAPVPYSHDFEDHLIAMSNLDITSVTRRSEAEAALLESLGDINLARFLVRNLQSSPDGGFSWSVNLNALTRHMDDLLDFPIFEADEAYEGSSFFLTGGDSEYVQSHHQAEIERLFTNAQISIVEGAGHWVHADKPDVTAAQLLQFIEG